MSAAGALWIVIGTLTLLASFSFPDAETRLIIRMIGTTFAGAGAVIALIDVIKAMMS